MSFDWNAERLITLIRMWADGHTAEDIAGAIHHESRSAVLGKINRLGLARNPKPFRVARPARKRPAKQRPPQIINETAGAEATDLPPEPVANPVTLMQLTEHTCRWPVDMPSGPMMYCGAEPAYGKSYCAHHCRLAFAGYGQAMSRAERELALRASRKAKAA